MCLLLGVPEAYIKLQLMTLMFVFLNILVKVLKWYTCQFDEIFIVNTEQLVIHQCHSKAIKFLKNVHLPPTCHMSYVMCNLSYVMCLTTKW